MSQIDGLIAYGVRNLQPYQPGKPVESLERELGLTDIIKLASNETQVTLDKIDSQYKDLQQAKTDLQRQLQEASVVNRISESISKATNSKTLLQKSAQTLVEELKYDRTVIMLANGSSRKIEYAASYGELTR